MIPPPAFFASVLVSKNRVYTPPMNARIADGKFEFGIPVLKGGETSGALLLGGVLEIVKPYFAEKSARRCALRTPWCALVRIDLLTGRRPERIPC